MKNIWFCLHIKSRNRAWFHTTHQKRVKINKILVTIKHIETQEVEEGEFDIEAMEKELASRSHYSSTNRWVPTKEIKNGYILNSRHTMLISDAAALDYIVY